jgi:hypothetical protein
VMGAAIESLAFCRATTRLHVSMYIHTISQGSCTRFSVCVNYCEVTVASPMADLAVLQE